MSCRWFAPPFFSTSTNFSQAVFYTSQKCGSCAPFCTAKRLDLRRRSMDRSTFSVCCVGERIGCSVVQYPQLVVHTDISENTTAIICEVLNQLYKCVFSVGSRVGTWKATRIYFFRRISTAVVGFLLDLFVRPNNYFPEAFFRLFTPHKCCLFHLEYSNRSVLRNELSSSYNAAFIVFFVCKAENA